MHFDEKFYGEIIPIVVERINPENNEPSITQKSILTMFNLIKSNKVDIRYTSSIINCIDTVN